MAVEVRALGVRCNIQCSYCYQDPIRNAAPLRRTYDLDAIKSAITQERKRFTLFGGEPLLMPLQDLEELLQAGRESFGGTSVQTNGTLISPAHIRLFCEYNVSVGVSVDGPGELNRARSAGNAHATSEATQRKSSP